MDNILQEIIFISSGLYLTLEVTFAAILIAIIFGTVLAVMKYTRTCAILVDAFLSIIRGTPLLVQLSIIYFSLPQLLNIRLSVLDASIIAFGLNSSAYTAVILYTGITSIPKGQFEAAKSLHISKFFTWKDIILPQVIMNIFPTLIHEVIALVKETAIISMIGGMDVTRRAQVVAAEQFTYFTPLCIAALSYYFIILILEYFGKHAEKKFRYAKNS